MLTVTEEKNCQSSTRKSPENFSGFLVHELRVTSYELKFSIREYPGHLGSQQGSSSRDHEGFQEVSISNSIIALLSLPVLLVLL